MEPSNGEPAPASGLLRNQIRTVTRIGENGDLKVDLMPIEHELTFDKGLFMFIRAVQVLRQSTDGIITVGLAGPSGAGKTVFSNKIRSFLPGTAHIQMDMYNDGSKVVDDNFDDPRITDYETLLQNIEGLKRGEAVESPVYDFKNSRRSGWVTIPSPEARVVVVEGIYALSDKLRNLLDLRVSIKGGVHFDLVKRVLRDIDRSGQQPEEILQQISSTVYPMYKIHIEPDLETAHLRIVNHFNPFSGLQNATYTLKSDKEVSEAEAMALLSGPDNKEVTRLEQDTMDIYLLPPSEDPETCQTWLRMRSRDGKYSLMFEEFVTDDPFIISPRISFEVSVRVMGGLMALGYKMKIVMKRHSTVFNNGILTLKMDCIEGMERVYVQIQGKTRELVAEAGAALGLDNTYTPHSYIEQVQLQNLTSEFKEATKDLKTRLALDGFDDSDYTPVSVIKNERPSRYLGKFNSVPSEGNMSRYSTQNLPPAGTDEEGYPSRIARSSTREQEFPESLITELHDAVARHNQLTEQMKTIMQTFQTRALLPPQLPPQPQLDQSLFWVGCGVIGAALTMCATTMFITVARKM